MRKPRVTSFLVSLALYAAVLLRYLATDVKDGFFDYLIEALALVMPLFLLFDLFRLVRGFGSEEKKGDP
jgi:hypothetical protein